MQHQPARAFRNVAAQQQHAEAEGGADPESDPPAEIGRQPARLQKGHGAERAEGGTEPKAAVDREIGAPAKPRRHQFLDRRVDRRILAADARPGQQPEQRKAREIPRERGRRRRGQVKPEGHKKQFAAAEPVGQIAEQQRAENRADKIGAADGADLGGRETQHRAFLQRAGDRAGEGHFEPVENPGDAEGGDDKGVKPGPRQPVEPRRDVGFDDRGGLGHASV